MKNPANADFMFNHMYKSILHNNVSTQMRFFVFADIDCKKLSVIIVV